MATVAWDPRYIASRRTQQKTPFVVQQYLDCCVRIRYRGNLFTESLLTVNVYSGFQASYHYIVFIVQAYQTSQHVVPCGGIFLGKWRSSFAGNSDGKMNVQSACALEHPVYTHKYIRLEYK
jgi:hypothetical protein